jgi:nitroimidazol reductase NimA-like FMN-containing flavoprotein (pyridoxamine 5'-phosphate oxidase superfamily)
MRRFKQELSDEKCLEVLSTERRGFLAVYGENGYPYVLPINYLFDNGKIYFHGAKEGHKLDAVKANPHVSFSVIDAGVPVEGKRGLNVDSVIVFGTARLLPDSDEAREIGRKLGLKYFPKDLEYIEHELRGTAGRMQIIEITIDHMTGKLVNES